MTCSHMSYFFISKQLLWELFFRISNSKRSFIRIETGESRNTIVITPKNKNEAYHFSAFCFGDANGVYCTATISSIKQESTACSVSKIDDSYEIVIGRWGLLNVVSAQAFSYSIK